MNCVVKLAAELKTEKGAQMNFLVAITGLGSAFWCLVIFTAVGEATDQETLTAMLVITAIHIFLFLICLKKYRSPEYKAKRQKAKDDLAAYKAAAPERKRQLEERLALEEENRRRATTVVSTRLIGASAPEYKKSVGDVVVRGAVGSLFGPAGTVVGMATAKEKNVNKSKRRFLVKYEDGHVEEMEASVGEPRYKLYMEHLEWD